MRDTRYTLSTNELIGMGWFVCFFLALVVDNTTKYRDTNHPLDKSSREAATLSLLQPLECFEWLPSNGWTEAAAEEPIKLPLRKAQTSHHGPPNRRQNCPAPPVDTQSNPQPNFLAEDDSDVEILDIQTADLQHGFSNEDPVPSQTSSPLGPQAEPDQSRVRTRSAANNGTKRRAFSPVTPSRKRKRLQSRRGVRSSAEPANIVQTEAHDEQTGEDDGEEEEELDDQEEQVTEEQGANDQVDKEHDLEPEDNDKEEENDNDDSEHDDDNEHALETEAKQTQQNNGENNLESSRYAMVEPSDELTVLAEAAT
ncbi:MAG: hypothetical protein M1829_000409 [Trizodia sp. TS-e1964]|nr:MAG: hypothetical protein M1829_000409 [Trizodia sp. TS-e1964]